MMDDVLSQGRMITLFVYGMFTLDDVWPFLKGTLRAYLASRLTMTGAESSPARMTIRYVRGTWKPGNVSPFSKDTLIGYGA
jgi:hypothetical protein